MVLQTAHGSLARVFQVKNLIHVSALGFEKFLPRLSDVHSTWVTLTENDLEKLAPLVTAVRTTGELEERPMSTYTVDQEESSVMPKNIRSRVEKHPKSYCGFRC